MQFIIMGIYLYIPVAMYPHSKNILEHRPEQNGTRNDGSLQQEVFPPHRLKNLTTILLSETKNLNLSFMLP